MLTLLKRLTGQKIAFCLFGFRTIIIVASKIVDDVALLDDSVKRKFGLDRLYSASQPVPGHKRRNIGTF
jgi:hypothetical protein